MVYRVICAWCGRLQRVLEDKRPATGAEHLISHTICPACKKRIEAELDQESQPNQKF